MSLVMEYYVHHFVDLSILIRNIINIVDCDET